MVGRTLIPVNRKKYAIINICSEQNVIKDDQIDLYWLFHSQVIIIKMFSYTTSTLHFPKSQINPPTVFTKQSNQEITANLRLSKVSRSTRGIAIRPSYTIAYRRSWSERKRSPLVIGKNSSCEIPTFIQNARRRCVILSIKAGNIELNVCIRSRRNTWLKRTVF